MLRNSFSEAERWNDRRERLEQLLQKKCCELSEVRAAVRSLQCDDVRLSGTVARLQTSQAAAILAAQRDTAGLRRDTLLLIQDARVQPRELLLRTELIETAVQALEDSTIVLQPTRVAVAPPLLLADPPLPGGGETALRFAAQPAVVPDDVICVSGRFYRVKRVQDTHLVVFGTADPAPGALLTAVYKSAVLTGKASHLECQGDQAAADEAGAVPLFLPPASAPRPLRLTVSNCMHDDTNQGYVLVHTTGNDTIDGVLQTMRIPTTPQGVSPWKLNLISNRTSAYYVT